MAVPQEKVKREPRPVAGEAASLYASIKAMEGKSVRRHTLKREEKLQIIEERDRRRREGIAVKQNDLMEWAKEKFGLPVPPSQSAMSRILCTKDKTELQAMPKVRRNRGGKLPELEEGLAKWVKTQQAEKIPVRGETIKAKGKNTLDMLNASLPPDERLSMQFSTGWLCNFQRRWNISLSGKDSNAEQEQESARLEDIDQLQQTTDRVGVAEGDANAFEGPSVLERTPEQLPIAMPKRDAEKVTSSLPKRERIPFWFVGLEKLSEDQFATRLVSYICKRVEVADKDSLRDAARTAARDNGIDGSTVVMSGNHEDEIAGVLLDDYGAAGEEKDAVIAAGKQFFVELTSVTEEDDEQVSHQLRKRQKQDVSR